MWTVSRRSDADDDDGEGLPVGDVGWRVGWSVLKRLKLESGLAEEDVRRRGTRGRARRGGGSSRGSWGACCSPSGSAAEEAEEVLVDEVEPEEAVAVHAAGVAEAGEDVPGGGDCEEEESAGEGF